MKSTMAESSFTSKASENLGRQVRIHDRMSFSEAKINIMSHNTFEPNFLLNNMWTLIKKIVSMEGGENFTAAK